MTFDTGHNSAAFPCQSDVWPRQGQQDSMKANPVSCHAAGFERSH